MAMRTVLCVEPDDAAVAAIREALGSYGFEIKNFANVDKALEWGKDHVPHLFIVSLEPRKVGYAICNKIKRSAEFKDIPLILASAEETMQMLEQHKKLKSRANEYILKPFNTEELVRKVDQLVGLMMEAVPVNSKEIILTVDSDEISIADGDIMDDMAPAPASPAAPPQAPPAKGKVAAKDEDGDDGLTPPASPFAGGPELDDIFDKETDAAFAALQAADADATGPIASAEAALPSAPSPWSEEPSDWDNERTRASSMSELELMAATPPPIVNAPAPIVIATATPAPVVTAAVMAAPPVPAAIESPADDVVFSFDAADVPPSLDEISAGSTFTDAPVQESFAGAAEKTRLAEAQSRELQARIDGLETERRRLAQEVEDLKGRLQSQPVSKEKDILTLREIINRKDKDNLDLRDSLDAKERLILDHKDRIREHERARRDLEEKSLGIEKGLMLSNERITALAQDKDKSIEREKGMKARLDDALMEIQKAHDEADALKRRLGQSEDRARAEIERIRGELQSRIAELEEHARTEIAKLNDERAAGEAALVKEHETELARMTGQHDIDLEAVQRRANEEMAALSERNSTEMAKLRKDSEKALASLKEEQSVQVTAERQAHQAAADAKERDHKNEFLALRRRHEEELVSADERRQRELAESQARHAVELEAADTRRRTELQSRDEQHHAVVAEMDRRHFTEKTELSERHRTEIDQAHVRAARAEGELAARTEELSEAYRRLSGHEGDLDAARADLRDREVKLAQNRDRVAQLESKATEYEDQILRAFQKLRADEKTVEKAKRALAVALSLLDDRGAAPAGATPTKSPSEESAP